MHLANSYYGHTRILAEYVGWPGRGPPILGMLQHGWNLGTGFTPDDPPRAVRRWLPAFVWTGANLVHAQAAGFGHGVAIGAPFAYLARMAGPGSQGPRETIVYPFHTWERRTQMGGTHDDYARDLAQREDPGTATVCLYWHEYDQPAVRAAYERLGFRVISHGHRGERDFLHRQLHELSGHRRLVTNRIGTHVWYGGHLGLELAVYGPAMGTEADVDGVGAAYEHDRGRWPELFSGGVDSARAAELAAHELGTDQLRDPDELRDLLWGFTSRMIARLLAPFTHALMRGKARIEGWRPDPR